MEALEEKAEREDGNFFQLNVRLDSVFIKSLWLCNVSITYHLIEDNFKIGGA